VEPGQKKRVEKSAPKSALEVPAEAEVKSVAQDWLDQKDLVHKGDYFSLTERDPTIRSIIIGAGWEQKSIEKDAVDVDLSCFLLDKTEKTRVDSDFIYFNNPSGCEGAVKLLEDSRGGAGEGDDERIFIDLNGLPFEIGRIVFAISIYDEHFKGHHFGDIRDLYLRIVNYESDQEIARFLIPLDELVGASAIYCAAMVREGPQWFLQPIAEAARSLSPIVRKYGLLVAEEAG
jgi:tellurium resistance protein TerD